MDHSTWVGLALLALGIPLFALAGFIIRVVVFGVLVRFTLRCIGVRL
jgi:hypothetical protein